MKRTRLQLVIVLAALGGLGVYLAVGAQEVFLPPPILDADSKDAPKAPETKVPAAAKLPLAAKGREKGKSDPSWIIPPEAYDVPHDLGPLDTSKPGYVTTDGQGGVVRTGGLQPAPLPGLPALPDAAPKVLAIPVLPLPPSPPEPTKMLIDPLTQNPPVVLPVVDTPPAPVMDRPKSFVRIQSGAPVTPPPLDIVPPPGHVAPLPPSANYLPAPGSPFNVLQTPALAVQKQGPATLRAGETQIYQLVVANLGAIPAQQVRVEEEIPPGARLQSAEPPPQIVGSKAIWTIAPLLPGQQQILRFSLEATIALQLNAATNVHVSALPSLNSTAMRPQNPPMNPPGNPPTPLRLQFRGPQRTQAGSTANFEIQVTNQSPLPLTGVKMFGYLPEGLNTPNGREIEMVSTITIAPGAFRVLKLPVNAVAPGRHTVRVKVVSSTGEEWATTTIEVASASLNVQQPETTHLVLGRHGELRIDLANGTGKALRHVQVACLLPEGVDYIGANERGLYQANHRTVYWVIDSMPAGQAKTLQIQVNGAKRGEYQSLVTAKADGIAEIRSTGNVVLNGMASLNLRVHERDSVLEVGKETVYEVQIGNSGAAPAHNVRLQVQLAAGLAPGNATGVTRASVQGQTIAFEPVAALTADQPAVFRVTAQGQAAGDQRVRFAVVSDEVQNPVQREVSIKVY